MGLRAIISNVLPDLAIDKTFNEPRANQQAKKETGEKRDEGSKGNVPKNIEN